MKRNQRKGDKMRVLWFCVLAALVAAPVWAQYPEGSKNRTYDGNARLVVTDESDSTNVLVKAGGVSGTLSLDDADRDRDKEYSATLWQAKLYANASSNSVDSSAVLDTQGWTYKTIALSATVKDSLSPSFALFAISVRGHLAASHDTLTTFPIMPYKVPKASGWPSHAADMSDTLGTGQADTDEGNITGFATPYEILIPIYPTAVAPRFKAINLNYWFGETGFRYTSYRIRLVGVYNGSGTNVVGNATVAGTLVGQR